MDAREIAQLFEALGEEPDDSEIAAAMKRLDADRNGRISFEELEAWWNDR
jgi:Ca2+-binding EF-hand superfamily protein